MTYLGYDVLVIDYNRMGSFEDRLDRKGVLLDGGTGKRTPDEQSPAPASERPFIWTAFGRSAIAELRDFLDARVGCAVPFWIPTLQRDLSLAEDVDKDDSIVSVNWVRYVEQMYGTTGARRHLALWRLGDISALDCYMVTDANDPGDKVTESLTIDPVAVRDYPMTETVISFLRLCRLEEDRVEISYPSGNVAEAVIPVRDLPMEAPA